MEALEQDIDMIPAEDVAYSAKLLNIIKYPNAILSKECEQVIVFDDTLRELITDMFYTMLVNKGLGLAAPQVGVLKRILVMNVTAPVILINPIIIEQSKTTTKTNEGCLSTPDVFADVTRPSKVTVAAQNELGEPVVLEIDGFQAAVVQHEIDHLNGKLFIDRLGTVSKMVVKEKLRKKSKHY